MKTFDECPEAYAFGCCMLIVYAILGLTVVCGISQLTQWIK